jgi:hypothetical protein
VIKGGPAADSPPCLAHAMPMKHITAQLIK